VSNDQIDALIQCATVVVSASLYEAGNGPGLDAWARGVPVAMSNIAAFMEHIEVQGVKAFVFDPRDPRDIAAKLREVLDDPDRARSEAEMSRRALENLTWRNCAAQYLQVFEQAAGR
jgi:glycosyltransferase involved in cell wall biosynthesis